MARFTAFLTNTLVQAVLLDSIFGSALAAQLTASEQSHLRAFSNGSDAEAMSTIVMKDAQTLQHLMICNAYAHTKAMEIFDLTTHTTLTSGRPLAYKDCSNYQLALREGEEFEFRAGNLSVGVFRATGVPRGPSSLLLIPHRRSPTALNAAFESHAFADMGSSQLVVIDVYKGKEAGKIKIKDLAQVKSGEEKEKPRPQRSEELKLNSVVQVTPGEYEILLQDSGDKSLSSVPLSVLEKKAKYVILRIGNQQEALKANDKPAAFPQELVVRQQTDSGAQAARLQLLALAAALLAGLVARL